MRSEANGGGGGLGLAEASPTKGTGTGTPRRATARQNSIAGRRGSTSSFSMGGLAAMGNALSARSRCASAVDANTAEAATDRAATVSVSVAAAAAAAAAAAGKGDDGSSTSPSKQRRSFRAPLFGRAHSSQELPTQPREAPPKRGSVKDRIRKFSTNRDGAPSRLSSGGSSGDAMRATAPPGAMQRVGAAAAAANGDDAETTEAFLERLQSAIDDGGGVSQSVSAGGTRGSLSNTRLQSVAL